MSTLDFFFSEDDGWCLPGRIFRILPSLVWWLFGRPSLSLKFIFKYVTHNLVEA
jgi:hypothetical protein